MVKKIQGLLAREQFYEQLAQKKLTLAETVKAMRAIIGMTQPEYAKFVGVAPRIIIDIERGVANPTLETLKKIGKPFRLDILYSYL
jgi:putative transcriptional regulator